MGAYRETPGEQKKKHYNRYDESLRTDTGDCSVIRITPVLYEYKSYPFNKYYLQYKITLYVSYSMLWDLLKFDIYSLNYTAGKCEIPIFHNISLNTDISPKISNTALKSKIWSL